MTARNDITGDPIASKATTNQFRDNWDRIFNKNKNDSQAEESAKKDEKKVDNPPA